MKQSVMRFRMKMNFEIFPLRKERTGNEKNFSRRALSTKNSFSMAEGVGFEPTLGLLLSLISSQVPSTTQPPFHRKELFRMPGAERKRDWLKANRGIGS